MLFHDGRSENAAWYSVKQSNPPGCVLLVLVGLRDPAPVKLSKWLVSSDSSVHLSHESLVHVNVDGEKEGVR